MEERDSLSLIYGFWVGFKSTLPSRPAQWSKNSLHESSMGWLFCFPELNSKAAFPPPTPFLFLFPYQHLENCLVPQCIWKKEGRKEGSFIKKAAKEVYHGQKKMRRVKIICIFCSTLCFLSLPLRWSSPRIENRQLGSVFSPSQCLTWQRLQH